MVHRKTDNLCKRQSGARFTLCDRFIKIQKELGWALSCRLRRGADKTVDWYLNNKHGWIMLLRVSIELL